MKRPFVLGVLACITVLVLFAVFQRVFQKPESSLTSDMVSSESSAEDPFSLESVLTMIPDDWAKAYITPVSVEQAQGKVVIPAFFSDAKPFTVLVYIHASTPSADALRLSLGHVEQSRRQLVIAHLQTSADMSEAMMRALLAAVDISSKADIVRTEIAFLEDTCPTRPKLLSYAREVYLEDQCFAAVTKEGAPPFSVTLLTQTRLSNLISQIEKASPSLPRLLPQTCLPCTNPVFAQATCAAPRPNFQTPQGRRLLAISSTEPLPLITKTLWEQSECYAERIPERGL